MTVALNGNKTANINVKKTAVYTNANGDIHTSKTAKIIKGDITQQHVDISATCWLLILYRPTFHNFCCVWCVNVVESINWSFFTFVINYDHYCSKHIVTEWLALFWLATVLQFVSVFSLVSLKKCYCDAISRQHLHIASCRPAVDYGCSASCRAGVPHKLESYQ